MNVDVLSCFELPFMTEELKHEWLRCTSKAERQKNIDKRTDMLATLLALYPDTETEVLAKQLGMTERTVIFYARMFGVSKSKEFRSEINRRNGEHPNKGHNPNARPVEKVARNGRVVATYRSTTEAEKANGMVHGLIYSRCSGRCKQYINGYKYRYKKQ